MKKIILACLVLCALMVSLPSASAAGYDEEKTAQTGTMLYFPDAISYMINDPRLAEQTVGRNGKTVIRFKRPGNLYLTVKFAPEIYGDYTRTYLIRITGHPVDETAVNRSSFAREILALVNAERAKVGAGALKLATDLSESADVRAHEIVRKFSHTRPDGSRCFTAVKNQGHGVGENIAGGSESAKKVMENWMNSPGHRANILKKEYHELGVGYFYDNNSEYKHYWVQFFRI